MNNKNRKPIMIISIPCKVADKGCETTARSNGCVQHQERECSRASFSNFKVPSDSFQVRESDNTIIINGVLANAESYSIIVPDKVVGVRFVDGGCEKAVLQEGDTFDLDDAIRICIAKHVGRKYYNLKGIQYQAERLSYLKCIDKMIDKLHRKYKKEQELQEKEIEEAKKRKAVRDARLARRAARKAEKESPFGVTESSVVDPMELPFDSNDSTKDVIAPKKVHKSPSKGHLNIKREKHRED